MAKKGMKTSTKYRHAPLILMRDKRVKLILDVDGVLRDVVGAAREVVRKTVLEVVERGELSGEVLKRVEEMRKDEFKAQFNIAQALSLEGVHLYAKILAYFCCIDRVKKEDGVENCIKEKAKLLDGERIAKLYAEVVWNQRMFPFAEEFIHGVIGKEDVKIYVISAAKGVGEWLKRELGDGIIRKMNIKEAVYSKEEGLLEIGDGIFITDTLADVKHAYEANERGAKVIPIVVLTGLSSLGEVEGIKAEAYVEWYKDVLEAGRRLGLLAMAPETG